MGRRLSEQELAFLTQFAELPENEAWDLGVIGNWVRAAVDEIDDLRLLAATARQPAAA